MTNFLTYLVYELYKFLICFWNKSESHLNFWSSFYLISLYYLLYFSDNWQFLITKDFIAFNNNDKFDLTILEQLEDTKFCIFLIFFLYNQIIDKCSWCSARSHRSITRFKFSLAIEPLSRVSRKVPLNRSTTSTLGNHPRASIRPFVSGFPSRIYWSSP